MYLAARAHSGKIMLPELSIRNDVLIRLRSPEGKNNLTVDRVKRDEAIRVAMLSAAMCYHHDVTCSECTYWRR